MPEMLFACCDGGSHNQTVDEIDALQIPRDKAQASLEAVHASADDLEDSLAEGASKKEARVTVNAPEVEKPAEPKTRSDSSNSAIKGESTTGKSMKSLNFDQKQDVQEIEVAGEAEDTLGTGDELRKKFGGRSATSRCFEKASTWSLDARETIDPSGGLRRKESVALTKGDIHSKYKVEQKLGEGSFGTVMRISDYETHQCFALKIIPVTNLKDLQRFEQELAISRRLKHPNIIVLHETFMEGEAYHLVMEMCTGGDLYDKIMGRAKGGALNIGLDAKMVGLYAWQMLTGVAYLHHYCFVHRDIKPENYLLSVSTPEATIKLIDFGLARECKKGVKMTSRVGTPHYVAPEVVADTSDGYVCNCDVWSIAVTLWFIAIGTLPFLGRDQTATLKAVVRGKYDFSSPLWALHNHPQELKDLIAEMLNKDIEVRPHAKQLVKENAWLKANSKQVITKKPESCCSVA